MNDYKITYTIGGEEHNTNIIERTEKAAERRLRNIHRDAKIANIELTDTEAPATKEQEREALETIRVLLEELGPNSYLRTAFEGCLEDAAQNIEDDGAYSMKSRYELAEEQRRKAEAEADSLREEVSRAMQDIKALKAELAENRKHIISEELRRDLWMMTTDEAEKARAQMATAADKMAMSADHPACVLFQESVTLYRAEKERAEAMERRAEALEAIEPKGT